MGDKIAHELELDDRADTLSLWMAHYIAELIQNVERAASDERANAQARCAQAILETWRYHADFPPGRRPLESFEPIVKTIESLDPDRVGYRYFSHLQSCAETAQASPEMMQWLGAAQNVDCAARSLIGYFIAQAAKVAVDKTSDWVKLALAAGVEKDVPLFIVQTFGQDLARTEIEILKTRLEDRIEDLVTFQRFASEVVSDLHVQLEQMQDPTGENRADQQR